MQSGLKTQKNTKTIQKHKNTSKTQHITDCFRIGWQTIIETFLRHTFMHIYMYCVLCTHAHNLYTHARQGSKGIRQWPMNWCTFPMMIHEITPSVDYNQWLNNPIKTQYQSLKLLGKQIRKSYYKTLGTSVHKEPNVPSLPWTHHAHNNKI